MSEKRNQSSGGMMPGDRKGGFRIDHSYQRPTGTDPKPLDPTKKPGHKPPTSNKQH